MNYSEPLISQITVFFRALGCGIILGILYDTVCMIRMLFGERKSVYVIFDTVYFLFASLISFFFMVLYNSGQVRLNLMLAELFGGIGFHLAFGKYIIGRYALQLHRIRKALVFILRPVFKVVAKIRLFCTRLSSRVRKKYEEGKNKEKISKKVWNIGKILLKNKNKSV